MPELIPFTEATYLFREFEHTAWRLETRKGYDSDRKSAKWRDWLKGMEFTQEPDNEWRKNVRAQTALGKRFERVRIVDSPPTDGQRFLLASGLGNVSVGEDIRNMKRADAERLKLPDFDFWLFDARTMMKLHFDAMDVTLGVEIVDSPEQVLAACQVRDAAWHHAIRTAEFQRQVRSGV